LARVYQCHFARPRPAILQPLSPPLYPLVLHASFAQVAHIGG